MVGGNLFGAGDIQMLLLPETEALTFLMLLRPTLVENEHSVIFAHIWFCARHTNQDIILVDVQLYRLPTADVPWLLRR